MKQRKQPTAVSDRAYTYDGKVARWWLARSGDAAHRYAYRNIANFLRSSTSHDPRLIIDYACGAGHLLSLLSRKFAHSRLIGLDGSVRLLEFALRRLTRLPRSCSKRISLVHTALPEQNTLRQRADMVVFCFPNMMPGVETERRAAAALLSPEDRNIAGRLAQAAASGGSADSSGGGRTNRDSRIVRESLEYGRSISLNLRQLLVRGGVCVRVEYATTRRHEWSDLELQMVCYEEGSLDAPVAGIHARKWFRVLASAYFRSGVLQDVYQQTGDRRDCNGGYLITVLRAV